MNTTSTIELASKNIAAMTSGMKSSAALCLADAYTLLAQGKDDYAKARALKSMAYSVGISHPDYRACAV